MSEINSLANKVQLVNFTHDCANKCRKTLSEYFSRFDNRKILKANGDFTKQFLDNLPEEFDINRYSDKIYKYEHDNMDFSIHCWAGNGDAEFKVYSNLQEGKFSYYYSFSFVLGRIENVRIENVRIENVYIHDHEVIVPYRTDYTVENVQQLLDAYQKAKRDYLKPIALENDRIEREIMQQRLNAQQSWLYSPQNFKHRERIKELEELIKLNGPLNWYGEKEDVDFLHSEMWEEPRKHHVRENEEEPFCEMIGDKFYFSGGYLCKKNYNDDDNSPWEE